MPFSDIYKNQVDLLVRTLPFVANEECFALKGGTAINLFIRDMPRLSVDIDLTYLPIADRKSSLSDIDLAMKRIATQIREGLPGADVTEAKGREGAVMKLFVRQGGVQIKIEVTPVSRGCVFDPEWRAVSPLVEDTYGFAEIQLVSFSDLYAGKIVAALDRQHPRDLFDVRDLIANEGIDDDLRRAFLVYLISHTRPMFEVLSPNLKELDDEYARAFDGMTNEYVPIEELVNARAQLIDMVVGDMPADHQRFLITFERGQPEWELLGIAHIADLPAVRWRQQNLDKITDDKRADLVTNLERVFAS